jgi:Fe2+ or Zn2+ uptake regulation protein
MGTLDEIRLEPKPPDEPEMDMCKCETCGKTFKVSELHVEVEQENWEHPQTYLVHYCPECEDGGEILDYFPSEESVRRWKKRK